ncbi:MAG: branched-chain amino acid ABC transporter substrate-binding protein, partial [Acetobacteraceae bacterium]|nr:branched-chain amino acid ABC transporter substrate-binding protein [Acetobacteraceae bacterium]
MRSRPRIRPAKTFRIGTGLAWTAVLARALAVIALGLTVFAATVSAHAEDTIKIAYTDPMSGPFAQAGQQTLEQMQYILDEINAKGGALGRKFELVVFDNKSQPSEELIALKSIADQNIPLVLQFVGSNIAAALLDGIEKHNARNLQSRILYLNGGAAATEFTNEKCSFWHFRFEANAEQKAMMLVRALPPEIKKVYLLNQDYLFGQSLKRDTERFLAKLRPDIAIVGNELMPLQKVQDFAPYVSKIKASGAQALLTGNWGPDLALLFKASTDAGLDVKYYTFYAHGGSVPTAIGAGGEGRVFSLLGFNENVVVEQGDPTQKEWLARFRATHNFDIYWGDHRTMLEYLQAAIEKAGAVDPEKIAEAMEGMARPDMLGHETFMRADDHQLFFPYYVSVFTKDVKYDSQGTGLGWK